MDRCRTAFLHFLLNLPLLKNMLLFSLVGVKRSLLLEIRHKLFFLFFFPGVLTKWKKWLDRRGDIDITCFACYKRQLVGVHLRRHTLPLVRTAQVQKQTAEGSVVVPSQRPPTCFVFSAGPAGILNWWIRPRSSSWSNHATRPNSLWSVRHFWTGHGPTCCQQYLEWLIPLPFAELGVNLRLFMIAQG